jgi:hypothetical protein
VTDLRPAFARLFDDASMFPPGNASITDGVARHREYRAGHLDDLVGPFICALARGPDLQADLDAVAEPLDVALIVPMAIDHPGRAVTAVTTERVAVTAIEAVVSGTRDEGLNRLDQLAELGASLGVPVYVERATLPTGSDEVVPLAERGLRLKFRTGGLAAAAYPSDDALAAAVLAATSAGVAFKCTAGLHRAVRHLGADGFEHHGFLNVLLATDAALTGGDVGAVGALLGTRDGAALATTLVGLGLERVGRARQSFGSFGTCSIDEPVADLTELGLVDAS